MAAGIALPAAVLAQVLLDDGSDAVFAFALVVMAGFVAGGYVAGSKRPDTPLSHGAVAALTCFVVVQAVGVAANLVRGDDVSPVSIAFNALLASSLGLLGGFAASRRAPA